MPHPVAYLRRSAADADSPGDVSRDVQEHAVRELAHRDGFNGDVEYFVDWARSADEEKSEKRTAYAAMLKRIEAGDVSHVYAYALDRLNRSITMSSRFAKACEDADVQIITAREGEVRHDSPDQWLRWTILATFGEYELRTIKARSASALARRRANGDALGRARYGYKSEKVDGRRVFVRDATIPLDTIRAAYLEAGSVLGACVLLREWGIPAPRGGTDWAASMVTRTIEHEWPELLPARTAVGRRSPTGTPAPFAHLLRCPAEGCGRMLTPNVARGQYYCAQGSKHRDTHPRYAVREADLMPWMKAEAARLVIGHERYEADSPAAIEARRAALNEQFNAAKHLFVVRDFNLEQYEAEKRRIQSEIDALPILPTAGDIPQAIDWETWSPEAINDVLRALWSHVELDADLRPVRAEWKLPAEYVAPI